MEGVFNGGRALFNKAINGASYLFSPSVTYHGSDWYNACKKDLAESRLPADPILISLDRKPITLVPLSRSETYFDFNGTGETVLTSWVGTGTGILISQDDTGALRLVTTLTESPDQISLLSLDADGNGIVDGNDVSFSNIKVWVDANSDGKINSDELVSLSTLDIVSVSTTLGGAEVSTEAGTIAGTVQTYYGDGAAFEAPEIDFDTSPADSAYVSSGESSDGGFLLELRGHGLLQNLKAAALTDPTLRSFVVNLDTMIDGKSSSYADLQSALDLVLFRWAGCDGIAPEARGDEIDARRLDFLEHYFGTNLTFAGYYASASDPGLLPALLANNAYLELRDGLLARVIVQCGAPANLVEYHASSDLTVLNENVDDLLSGFYAESGPLSSINLDQWRENAATLNSIFEGLGFTADSVGKSLRTFTPGVPWVELADANAQGLSASVGSNGELSISNLVFDGILTPGFGRPSGLHLDYGFGDGVVSLDFVEPAWLLAYQGPVANTLNFDGNVSDYYMQSRMNGDVTITDGVAGDVMTLIGEALTGDGLEHGIQQFVFADGNIRTWSGNQEIYALASGYGRVIADPSGNQDTIALGSGILAPNVTVHIDPASGALVLTAGADYMTIQGNYALGISGTRVSTISFADGTTWAMDGSYAFGVGEGHQTWNTGGQDGHVRMGADVDPQDVIMQSNAVGDLTITLRSDLSDSITFLSNFYTFFGGTSSHIKTIDFGDGSSLDLTGRRAFTWIANAADTSLVGSGWGENEFDLAAGGDTVTAGNGNPGGDAANLFVFGRGDGHATVDMNGGTGVLKLGSGIQASDLLLQAHPYCSLAVSFQGDADDSITFTHDLAISFQNQSAQLYTILFADGTSMSLAGPVSSTWVGDASGAALAGSNWGPNLFLPGMVQTPITFAASASNTVVIDSDSAGVAIDANGGVGNLVLQGVSLSDIYFQTQTGSSTLTIRFRDNAIGPITVANDLAASFGNYASSLQTIQADDGVMPVAQVTSTWIAAADHTTLVGSNWGPNVFELGSVPVTIMAPAMQSEITGARGSQGATITMNGGKGTLVLPGVSVSDLILGSAGTSPALSIDFADGAEGKITINDEFSTYFGTRVASITSIQGSDGTIDLGAAPLSFTWAASTGNTVLTGSDRGSNTFILSSGDDEVFAGDGSQGGSNQNTVKWALGDGHATVHVGSGAGTVILGAGITASDVMFQANAAGDLTIAIKGDTADTITLKGDLYSYYGVGSRFGISLSDGTSIGIGRQADGSYVTPRFTWQQTQPGQVLVGTTWGSNDFLLAPGGSAVTTEGDVNNANFADTISYDRGDGLVTATVYDSFLQALKLGTGFTAADVLLQQDPGTNDLVVAFRGDADDRIVFPIVLYSDPWGVLDQVRGVQFSDGSYLPTGIPYWGQGGPLTFTWVADATHTSLSGSGYGGNIFETAAGGDIVTLGNGANGGSAANLVHYHSGDGAVSILPNGGSVQVSFSGIREADVSWATDAAGDLIATAVGGTDTVTVHGILSGNSDVQAVFGDGTLTRAQLAFSTTVPASASLQGTSGDDLLDGHGITTTVYGAGGNDGYVFRPAYGSLDVFNAHAANTGPEGRMLLGTGIDGSDLWFDRSGDGLLARVLGTPDSITVHSWFGADPTAQLTAFVGGDGRTLDSGLNSLVSAMAAYEAATPGFSPTTASAMPLDRMLQSAIADAWHS